MPSFYAFEAHRAAGRGEIDVREFEARVSATGRGSAGRLRERGAAIDDAEFDLATLGPADEGVGAVFEESAGRAVASLRGALDAWHKTWKAADGLFVKPSATRRWRFVLGARAWSPSTCSSTRGARAGSRCAIFGCVGEGRGIQRMDPATRGSYSTGPIRTAARSVGARSNAGRDAGDIGWRDRAWRRRRKRNWRRRFRRSGGRDPGIRADLRGWLQERRCGRA